MTCYYFIVWIQTEKLSALVITGICTFFATLSRYDGWPLFLAILSFIPVICLLKKRKFLYIQGNMLLFTLIGGLGIALWLIWNEIIFGDPLYFQHSTYSSQAQQTLQLQAGMLFSYHNPFLALKYYVVDSQQTVGYILFSALAVGLVWFLLKNWRNPIALGFLAFFVPFGFYILALYNGNAIIWVPGANPPGSTAYMYNVRYGVQIVPALAITLTFIANSIKNIKLSKIRFMFLVVLIGMIISQNTLIQMQGIISLQDGEYNTSCQPQKITVAYLAKHYNGGYILQDVFPVGFDASDAGLDFHSVIYEGSNTIWLNALADPEHTVDWILVNPTNPLDLVAKNINLKSASFLASFVVVAKQSNGILLYHRINGIPLANRPAPVEYTYPHYACL